MKRTALICIAICFAFSVIGHADPPEQPTSRPAVRKPSKAKKQKRRRRPPPTSQPVLVQDEDGEWRQVFTSTRGMNKLQKQQMRDMRFHVFRLKKEAQAAIKCSRCKGRGKAMVNVKVPKAGETYQVETVKQTCPKCGGTRILPSPGAHEALAAYVAAKRRFDDKYVFAAPLKTGLESWIMSGIKTLAAVANLNADCANRFARGDFDEGDVCLLGVRVFNVIDDDPSGMVIVQALLEPYVPGMRELNVMIVLPDDKRNKIRDGHRLFVMAVNDGPVVYHNVYLEDRTAQVMTLLKYKRMHR